MGYASGKKRCYKCGMTIPNSAEVCPYCGSNVKTLGNRIDNFFFKIVFWAVLIIVVIAVIKACIG